MSKKIMNILMLGDLIGNPGIKEVFLKLSQLKKKENIDLTIANGENSDNGFGITEAVINDLKEYGVDIITSGNHIWSNDDAAKLLYNYNYLLRPANYPKASGNGYWSGEINGVNVGVVNLIGRYFMTPVDCPFAVLEKLIKNELKECSVIVVDFHAEYVAEKKALAFDFDGKISLIAGTHIHVQTADEMILPNGTAYITDLGICGGLDSIIGMNKDDVLKKTINQTVVPYVPSEENLCLQGVIAAIDTENGRAVEIKRISI